MLFSQRLHVMPFIIGQHGGSVVSTVASQQEGLGFESRSFQVLSVWSLHVLPVPAWVYSGYSGFPHHHKDMHCMNMNECWWWSEGPLALIGSHASVSLPQGSCGY